MPPLGSSHRKRRVFKYSIPQPLPGAIDENGEPEPSEGWVNGIREQDVYTLWAAMQGANRPHVFENLELATGIPLKTLKFWREKYSWDDRLETIHLKVDDIVAAKTAITVGRALEVISDLSLNAQNESVRLKAAMAIEARHDRLMGRASGGSTNITVDKMLVQQVRGELTAGEAEKAASAIMQEQLDRTNQLRTTKQTSLPALARSGRY